MKHAKAWAAAAAMVTLLAGAPFAASWAAGNDRGGDSGGADEVVVAHASDRLPNRTASDWVTYADHVVVVTATAERELPADPEEVEAGQGYIPREVTLEVDDVVWSRAGAAESAPAPDFTWPAPGWTFRQDGSRSPMALEDRPRVEVGHRYLMALTWRPAFTEEGETIPGQWRGLGENSTLPYDDGVIGRGESEGSEQAAAAAEHADEGEGGPSLKKEMTGRSATDLRAALDAAQPTARQDFGR
ncbi:hypothetical protein O7599_31060 [Streptomyces sp. WMMC500]|uniref:hypothetical protein n=1 Tax=Streptomyces sp. WMMC500 TaxID=3015154 RepID=UPI00248AC543|nr:hypothetical protein [Streptomyces sp. WMMC500]WBB59940.1 hypothetical protein O7599_31060 [Streptomyces sp. WMMC500]